MLLDTFFCNMYDCEEQKKGLLRKDNMLEANISYSSRRGHSELPARYFYAL